MSPEHEHVAARLSGALMLHNAHVAAIMVERGLVGDYYDTAFRESLDVIADIEARALISAAWDAWCGHAYTAAVALLDVLVDSWPRGAR